MKDAYPDSGGCSANEQFWKSVRNVFGNVTYRPGQKIYSLPPSRQRNASHSDFSVRLLLFPTVHLGQESHSKNHFEMY